MKAICRDCGVEKEFSEFNKHIADGPLEVWNLRRCKDCSHKDYLRRYSDPDKRATQQQASRNWKANNLDRHAELAKEYRAKNKEKTKAHNRLNYAIKIGKIKRLPCEVCGTTERVHGHHVSYEPKDWLNVNWLCKDCHKLEHMTYPTPCRTAPE